MGVPKFFRYISERYPCLSELIRENQVPEFDNLYLDMNGIIHNCSHPNDNDVHFRISEEQIFKDIFHYLDLLFNMIKPQKLFFLAVDGVAPRAKMNQQRGRRFRSAKEAELLEQKAREKGEILPTEARFDSNCITPGTPFMCRLNNALRYFIQYKISTCRSWRDCKVILSGHETPGEGEHKIMEHIRFLKTQKDYDANTRHCLYGLDADLIMLGLCTHERHFSLLREEVKFGKKNNKAVPVDQQRFFLLHLSLMREYLEQEFIALKDNLKFKFDIENIIDDWVLMGFLVGNDFIPNIPNLHINSNALPMLYETYIRTLPSLDGYINEGGQLNLTRLQKYIENLAEFDRDNFSSTYDDLKFLETKHQGGFNDRNDDTFGGNSDLMNMVKATEFEFDSSPEENDENDMPFMNAEKDLSDDELFEKEFHQHRRNYYVNKMKYEEMTPAVLAEQAECYIRALQWTLSYYYHGVQSWGWFYPHHYAPFISDLKNFKNFTIDFEMGKPFLPFQQLMSVLPAASREHVPVPYQKLMTNPDSELIDFYPTNFETDLNGKKQEWEAVVLIPFIEEERLLKTLQKCDVELSAEERARNVHGPMYVYTYASTSQGSVDGPGTFPSIGHVMCNEKKIFREEIQVPKDKLVLGPSKGTFTNVYYSGFPTLKHLNYTSVVKKQSVKVFDQPSRGDSMIIVVSANEDELDAPPTDVLAKQLIGKTVHVGWPHLIEARIVKIADNMNVYTSDEVERMEGNRWSSDICSIKDHHKNRMGIEVGDIKRIVYAAPVTGEEYKFDPQLKIFRLIRTFSRHENAYPLQCIVQNINAYRKKFKKEIPLVEAFKNGTEVFMLTNPYYGAFGEVVDVNCYEKTGRIKVLLTVPQEPSFEDIYELHERNEGSYLNAYNLSAALNISENVINRITGSVLVIAGNKRMVTEGTSKVNIGLQLKFPKQNEELAGYTKKDRMWFYSEKATKLIEEYYSKYPSVFAVLGRNTGGNDIYYESDFFLTTEGEENLSTLLKWLGTLPHRKADRRPVGSESVEKDVLEAIIKSLDKTKDSPLKKITMQVKLHLLYVPTLQKTSKSPDPRSQFYLFDRIVIAKGTDKMPVGLKGTVIGINRVKDLNPVRQDCINKEDIYCEILFDSEISDGLNLYGIAKNRVARVVIENLINISYGESLTQTISTNVKPAPVSRSRYTETKKPNGATRQNYAQNASQQAFSAIMQKNENGNSNKPKFADMWNALKNSGDDTKKSSTVVQQRNVMPTNAWNNMKNGPSGQTKEQEPFQHSPSPAIDRKPQPKDTSDDVNKQIESINLNNNSVPYVAPPANLPAPPMEWIKGTSESHTKPKPELSKQRPTVMPPQAGFIKVPQAYQTMPPQNFFPVSLPMNAGPVPMMTSQFQGTSLMNTAPANLPYNHNITGPPPGAYYRNGNGQQNPPGQFFTNNQGRNYFNKPPPNHQQPQQHNRYYNNQNQRQHQFAPVQRPQSQQMQQQSAVGSSVSGGANPFIPLQAARKSTKGKNIQSTPSNDTSQPNVKTQVVQEVTADQKKDASKVETDLPVTKADSGNMKPAKSSRKSRLAINFEK